MDPKEPHQSVNSDDLLRDGMGITDWKRTATFASAQDADICAKTLNLSAEDWSLQLSRILQWKSTKVAPVAQPQIAQLYQPIRDPYEIRVLKLHPGTGTDKLRGALLHCSVEPDPPDGSRYRWAVSMNDLKTMVCYIALSYCWGQQKFDASIECDGYEKRITKSLEAAIRQLRDPKHTVVLWIDQICINQVDNREKEQQISLMERIYSRAFNTVIWLGEGTDDSNVAMKLLDKINWCLQFSFVDIDPKGFKKIGLPPPDSQSWGALWKLLSREWFTRLWIIQEAILPPARTLWVACGGSIILWEVLSQACNHLVENGISRWIEGLPTAQGTGSRGVDVCRRGLDLGTLRSEFTVDGAAAASIFEMLRMTRNSRCYDPRDKVYGLLGVCSGKERAFIKVSYAEDCTAEVLYQDLASRYIGDKPHAVGIVLAYTDHDSTDLPSWVPDWRVKSQVTPLGAPWYDRVYNACGGIGRNRLQDVDAQGRGQLCVQGLLVDSIARTSDIFASPDLSYEDPAFTNKALLDCVDFATQFKGDTLGDTLFDAFWHTIVAGKNGAGNHKSPSDFAEVFSLLLDETTGFSPTLPGQTYSIRQKRPKGKGKGRLELSNLASRQPGETFKDIRTALKRALTSRRLGITRKGRFGLFPHRARGGDDIYVLEDCTMPQVMTSAEGSSLRFIGECYVYGIMDGEALNDRQSSMTRLVIV